MALAPQFVGHRMGSAFAPHTLEVYLDYVVSNASSFVSDPSFVTKHLY
jgi:hypothetical protein